MDLVSVNLQENLEEERRRLAMNMGRALADDDYVLLLQWTELLVSLELRTRWPGWLAGPTENLVNFWLELLSRYLQWTRK